MQISSLTLLKCLWLDLKKCVYNRIKCYELQISKHANLGSNIRIKAIQNLNLGEDVKILDNVFLHCGQFQEGLRHGKISIGNDVYIGPFCVLFGTGEIEIGDNCLISPGTIITSRQHTFADLDMTIGRQTSELARIVIEEDVWIGSNAVILPGIRIGRGSVIGAGAVVTKHIPPYSVAVGVPARVIKNRKQHGDYELEQ